MSKYFNKLEEVLSELNKMQAELKRRCMIFQVESKERAAIELAMPIESLYNLSYNEWGEIYQDIEKVHDEAEKAWYNNKNTVPEFDKLLPDQAMMGEIWSAYFQYLKRIGNDKQKTIREKTQKIIDKHK